MPYISAPYRTHSLVNNIRSSILQVPIAETGGRQIDLAPWPESIDKNGIVKFRDNGRPEAKKMRSKACKPDVLIFATGYKQEFCFLDKSYATPDEANIRNIWKSGDETVGFIGFVRPSFGKSSVRSSFPNDSHSTKNLDLANSFLKEPSHHSLSFKHNFGFWPCWAVSPTVLRMRKSIASEFHLAVGFNTASTTNLMRTN